MPSLVMSSPLDDLVRTVTAALEKLSGDQRSEFFDKIAASRASFGNDDGLSAARDALKGVNKHLLTPTMAAAQSREHLNEVVKLTRELAAFGFELEPDKHVSMAALNKALAGDKRAWTIKNKLAALKMIDP